MAEDAANKRVIQFEVLAKDEFPKRAMLRLERADGATFECECAPELAHKMSDDLIRAVAALHRSAPKPASGEETFP